MKSWVKKQFNTLSVAVSGLLAVPYGKQLEKFFSNIINETPTVYGKTIDKFYNETHIGGALHRLFDQSHSPIDMWEKVKVAVKDDTKLDELKNNAVLFKKDEDIAIVTLNRPDKYNAVNDDLVDGLNKAIAKVQKDDSIRAMVLTGAGKGFCSGADMNTFGNITPDEGRTYLTNTYGPLMRNLTTLKKPIIAAINGTAAGVGASIALACDFRVMSENSGLLYAFINIGLGPDGGASWLLARQVGYSRALQIAVEGKKIKGDECHKLGLTNKLVENDAIVTTAIDWAHQIAKLPTLAVGITKEDMFHAMDHDLYSTIAYEAERQTAAFASHDLVEGVSAFLQKRKPKFIGK